MSKDHDYPTQIREIIVEWSTRWRMQRGFTWAIRGFLIGWIIGIARSVTGLLASELIWTAFLTILVSNSLVFSILFFAAAYSWPIQTIQAARYFDRRLNLFDRLSTSVELAENIIGGTKIFRLRQWQDTLNRANQIKIKDYLPISIPRAELALAFLAIVSLIPIQYFSAGRFRRAAITLEVRETIVEETEALTELLNKITETNSLDPNTISDIKEPLESAIEKLSQAETLESAVAALEGAQETLAHLGNPSIRNLNEAIRSLSWSFAKESSPELAALAESFETGEARDAAEGLRKLASDFSASENPNELADALNILSHQLAGIAPDLAASLAEASVRAQTDDFPGAKAALIEAADRLSELTEEQFLADTLDQVNNLVAASQDRLLENAGTLTGTPLSQGGQPGSLNAGSSSVNGEGSGSGAGTGSSDPSDSAGGTAGLNPIDTQNRPGDGGEVPYSSLFVPENLGGEDTTGVVLPDQEGAGDQVIGQTPGNIQPGAGSTIPYQEVFPVYNAAARQAIESGQVPNHLLDLVRAYFSSLEP